MSQTVQVRGLTCGHCAHAVTEELSAVPGVAGVEVELVPSGISTVVIDAEVPLTEDQIRTALSEAGDYELA